MTARSRKSITPVQAAYVTQSFIKMRGAGPRCGGDLEAAAIWRAITAAIEELQRGRQDGEAVN